MFSIASFASLNPVQTDLLNHLLSVSLIQTGRRLRSRFHAQRCRVTLGRNRRERFRLTKNGNPVSWLVGEMPVEVFISIHRVHLIVRHAAQAQWNPRRLAILIQYRDEFLNIRIVGIKGVEDKMRFPEHATPLAG